MTSGCGKAGRIDNFGENRHSDKAIQVLPRKESGFEFYWFGFPRGLTLGALLDGATPDHSYGAGLQRPHALASLQQCAGRMIRLLFGKIEVQTGSSSSQNRALAAQNLTARRIAPEIAA